MLFGSVSAILFLSTPSARRATKISNIAFAASSNLYPRPPRGGRLYDYGNNTAQIVISIHALREEGDINIESQREKERKISIHALREEGDKGAVYYNCEWIISIHALREEGDTTPATSTPMARYFYPRPPRGGRPAVYNAMLTASQFLSTPSARRATFTSAPRAAGTTNFYPRPPRGGRQVLPGDTAKVQLFLSTPSARRATCCTLLAGTPFTHFYPRPPRGGRRPTTRKRSRESRNFYPRPPRGGRPLLSEENPDQEYKFLSTPSARRATRQERSS